MEVIDPGHRYKLRSLDGEADCNLIFVKREGAGYPGNAGSHPGTTCQEVLRALVNRLDYLNNQIPCWQNRLARSCCLIALWLFEHRHAKRRGRRLTVGFWNILSQPVCGYCGHIQCREHN